MDKKKKIYRYVSEKFGINNKQTYVYNDKIVLLFKNCSIVLHDTCFEYHVRIKNNDYCKIFESKTIKENLSKLDDF